MFLLINSHVIEKKSKKNIIYIETYVIQQF
jgi:hypothetical protein